MDGPGLTVWDYCRPFIAAALQINNDETIEEVERRVLEGTAHLWPGDGCAGVTEYIPGPALHIWHAGGSLRGLLAMRESVEAFARASECKWVELDGRRGWARVFGRLGYSRDGTRVFKTL